MINFAATSDRGQRVHSQMFDERVFLCVSDIIRIDSLVQDFGNSLASSLELPQSCSKPSIYTMYSAMG